MINACKIYKISNTINSKIYIGQTWTTLKMRFNSHFYAKKTNSIISNAMRKYGKKNFKIEIIGICYNQEDADNMEDFFIKNLNTIKCGYNIKNGGSCGKHSQQTKDKISKLNKGKLLGSKMSDEVKAKMSKAQLGNKKALGKKQSPEHIAKRFANAKNGKGIKRGPQSPEHIAKRFETIKRNKQLKQLEKSAESTEIKNS
jgi:group I intron endonuclease